MADAAVGDVDLDIVETRGSAGNLDGFQRLVACVGAIGVDSHVGSGGMACLVARVSEVILSGARRFD
jgi:hypothetical protein